MQGDLFGEEEQEDQLKINEDFAERFERRERRKELERLNQEEIGNPSEDSSSGYSEDSDGDLINQAVGEKFIKTIVDLRSGKVNSEGNYFSDDDFDLDDAGLITTKRDKATYKDLIRQSA